MKIDLDQLERVARAAQERSPGPWRRWRWHAPVVDSDGRFDWIRDSSPKPDGFDDYDGGEWIGKTVLETDGGYYEPKGVTGEFIENCSPDVVLALVAALKTRDEAIRFLWNAWSEAEGDGQPKVYVFGDAKMDAWLKGRGETHRERAPEDVQAVIREAIK